MLKSYFLTAIRSILRHKFISLIHILGLAIGLSSFLLSYYHLQYEKSYDRQYAKSESIYRIVTGDMESGEGWVKVSAPLPIKLKSDIPQIQEVARMVNLDKSSKTAISVNNQTFYERDFFLADPTIVHFFDLHFTQGNKDALQDPKSIVISQSKAEQIFGFVDPINQVLRINDEFEYTVRGIFEDLDEHSHLALDFVVSFQNLPTMLPGTSLDGNWGQFNYFAYALLHPSASEKEVEAQIQSLQIKLSDENTFRFDQINLQPLTDIHFQENRGNLKPSTNMNNLWSYGIAALAILLISIINYVNLSVASSTKRLKEVGLRKTIGALRSQLIFQFIGESFVTVSLSLIFAIAVVNFVLIKMVNRIFDLNITAVWSDPTNWVMAIILLLLMSFISGSYIAYYIVRVNPMAALKDSQGSLSSGNTMVRNLLLGAQFVIAATLLTSILFVQSQLKMLVDQDLGIAKEGVITIPLYESDWRKRIRTLKDEISNLPEVTAVSGTGFQPGIANWHQTVWWENQLEDASMNIISADVGLFSTLGLELIEGNLDELQSGDQQELKYVLNESAIRSMGWTEANGKLFSPFGPNAKKAVAGIVKDFNYKSLHHPIEPCVLVLGSRFEPSNLLVKISSSNISASIQKIESKLSDLSPGVSFQYDFLDQKFMALYTEEIRSQKLISAYTYIAIFLCTLGLFNLISFEVNRRTKEMAIRRVLGISQLGTGILISSQFLGIVAIACGLSIPFTIYLVQGWLQHFTYQIPMRVELFAFSIGLIFVLIILTTLAKIWQVNRHNVAELLRQD